MDQILYWDAVALESERLAGNHIEGGSGASRALAIARVAMHDAHVSAVRATHATYLTGVPSAPVGASPEAAVAVAAHTTLTALYPGQIPRLDAALQGTGLRGRGVAAGTAHGLTVAQELLTRVDDPGLSAWLCRSFAVDVAGWIDARAASMR
ncbi:hypothetical protein [Nocardia aurantia]|uniref:Vanadium chloroperoxidase N-terminal domain-containing protein n=1 Tax=Nocardia aurantia TaxID=2585199 RepID=A0A7K0DV96_9NOCA|nr:hypothetical protein [Nocardia aurantia]MQY29693.1 hypothetical protein [Nocardia aurantia]